MNHKVNNDSVKTQVEVWWAENPMTYADKHGGFEYAGSGLDKGTKEFFDKVDKEFYSWNIPLHRNLPFDLLFPYDTIKKKAKVLEIGCGLGTMAMNWAEKGVDITAIDLNPVSIEQTKKRFKIHNLRGNIFQANGNELPFEDGQFDYVYSWGVLHHSPSLEKSISELLRVTRPGGLYGVMLYNRQSLAHWYVTEYVEGLLNFESEFLGPLELASRYGDGYREEGNPHTWPVKQVEMEAMLLPYSSRLNFKKLGTELDGVLLMLWPGIGAITPSFIKKIWARRYGWSLWMEGEKLNHAAIDAKN